MSRVAELARAEADRVEAEDPEPEPEPEPTPEPEPGPPAPVADMPVGIAPEKVAAAIEKEHARHLKELTRIMGAAPLFECEACNTLGYTLDPSPSQAGLKEAPDKQRCTECDGWGKTITGARDTGQPVADCGRCFGTGHVPRSRDLTPQTPLPPPPTFTVTPPSAPFVDVNGMPTVVPPDFMGRLANDAHYGQPPSNSVPTVA